MRIVALTQEQYEMVEAMVDNDAPRADAESRALNRASASQLHNGYTQQVLGELREKLRTFRGDANLSLLQHVYLEECRAILSVILDDATLVEATAEERLHRADYLGFGYVQTTTSEEDAGRVLVVVAPNGRRLQWDWDHESDRVRASALLPDTTWKEPQVSELPPNTELAREWEMRH